MSTSTTKDTWPLDAQGWTILMGVTGSADSADDTRLFYVDPVGGTASPSPAYYNIGDAEIGDDPRQPTGTPAAYLSATTAFDQMRNGKPDWHLTLRGTTGDVHISNSSKSGVGYTAPMVFTSYGDPTDDMPVWVGNRDNSTAIYYTIGTDSTYTIIKGIELRNQKGISNSNDFDRENMTPFGVDCLGGNLGFRVEGCYLNHCGFICQSYGGSTRNFSVRRNIVFHNWENNSGTGDTGHVQGMFLAGVRRSNAGPPEQGGELREQTDALVEENIWDWNGLVYDDFDDDQALAVGTIFNRNNYITNTANLEVKGNIYYRSASTSAQLRAGGLFQNNIVGRAGAGINYGSSELDVSIKSASGLVKDNYFFGHEITTSQSTPTISSVAINLTDRADKVTIIGNIFSTNYDAGQSLGTGRVIAVNVGGDITPTKRTIVQDNCFYNWNHPDGTEAQLFRIDVLNEPNVTVRGNEFYQGTNEQVFIIENSIPVGLSLDNNTYYVSGVTQAFDFNDFDTWVTQTGDNGVLRDPNWKDKDRNIVTYMASIGGIETEQAFIEAAKDTIKREVWDPRFSAYAVIDHVREGFNKTPTNSSPPWYSGSTVNKLVLSNVIIGAD